MILSYPLTTVDRPTDRPLTIVKCIYFFIFQGNPVHHLPHHRVYQPEGAGAAGAAGACHQM